MPPASRAPLLYSVFADWFPLLTAPASYAGEARFIAKILKTPGVKRPSLLELGSGGGNTASHLKKHFDMTLSDVSGDILAVSKRLNPDLAHVKGDMRTLRLKRTFDAVLIHDAIGYMTSARDLARALATAAHHLPAGGLLLVMPDAVAESYAPKLEKGGHDDDQGRSLRYVQSERRRGDTKLDVTFTVTLSANGQTRLVTDRHAIGLFPRAMWMAAFRDAGFSVKRFTDPWERECFLGQKRAAPKASPAQRSAKVKTGAVPRAAKSRKRPPAKS
jgi:SAM-dependent methyltransferase